ncbi:Glycosyltransferase [Operophtera brumata]|uniref:Glycosyltransferase n=1 Tax=Operophtera brumata TaxID=104452 RepID=A0A0L7LF57_OPEBR|nr:Glycosyltransferase [Operophtera brumata]
MDTTLSKKPKTMAELLPGLGALQSKSPSKAQASASVKKRWNSSCKPENKFVRHTANGQMKHNSVRKVLNFQPHKPQERKKPMPENYYKLLPKTEGFKEINRLQVA